MALWKCLVAFVLGRIARAHVAAQQEHVDVNQLSPVLAHSPVRMGELDLIEMRGFSDHK